MGLIIIMSTTLFLRLLIESVSLVLFFDEEVDVNINGRKKVVVLAIFRATVS